MKRLIIFLSIMLNFPNCIMVGAGLRVGKTSPIVRQSKHVEALVKSPGRQACLNKKPNQVSVNKTFKPGKQLNQTNDNKLMSSREQFGLDWQRYLDSMEKPQPTKKSQSKLKSAVDTRTVTPTASKAPHKAHHVVKPLQKSKTTQEIKRPIQPQVLQANQSKNQAKESSKVGLRNCLSKFDNVKSLFGSIVNDRQALKNLREKHIALYQNQENAPGINIAQLMKDITQDTKKLLQGFIEDTLKKIGPAPVPFCIISLGSLARQETGFYTDLEIGILVKEKNIDILAYFKKFSQALADKLFLLGEHPDVGGKGLRMDEADNSPFHNKFFARYASPEQVKVLMNSAIQNRNFDLIPTEGSRLFIATCQEFADHVNPKLLEKQSSPQYKKERKELKNILFEQILPCALNDPRNKFKTEGEIISQLDNLLDDVRAYSNRDCRVSSSISNLSRNVTYLYGDLGIFNNYLQLRDKLLNEAPQVKNSLYGNRRQEIVYFKMAEDIANYLQKADKSSVMQGKLQAQIDLKRELYRFPEQLLTNLGFWHACKSQNTIDIVQELAQRKIISQCLAKKLTDLMNYCMNLRLRKQEKMRRQTFSVPVTMEEYESMLKKLKAEIANLTASRNFLMKLPSTSSQLSSVEHKLMKAQTGLNDLEKMKPGVNAILDQPQIDALNNRYLPLLQTLFNAEKSFVEGDRQAFARLN